MAKREPLQPSPKLQSLLREFQQIATMSGFLNHGFDPPQLRMQFTLYGRVRTATEAEGLSLLPRLQAWSERLGDKMREESSAAILPPQIMASPPQQLPDGGFIITSTLTFTTKVTDQGYFKVKTALLAAYQEAVRLREEGFKG